MLETNFKAILRDVGPERPEGKRPSGSSDGYSGEVLLCNLHFASFSDGRVWLEESEHMLRHFRSARNGPHHGVLHVPSSFTRNWTIKSASLSCYRQGRHFGALNLRADNHHVRSQFSGQSLSNFKCCRPMLLRQVLCKH